MLNLDTLKAPTLLLDESICRNNIQKMAQKARRYDLEFKPHFKTHQSNIIGRWFADAGVDAITVSSIRMAQYFSESGWDDITIAFPVNPRKIPEINSLAAEKELSLILSDVDIVNELDQQLDHSVRIYVEIDTGSHRTGLEISQMNAIEQLVDSILQADKLELAGFYTHPGHSYDCKGKVEIQELHRTVTNQFEILKNHFSTLSKKIVCCTGDTPCSSVAESFETVDEISPGNFVFYDLMQSQIGSCVPADIAVSLACPVVGIYPARNEIVLHGGAVHLSKDFTPMNDHRNFGTAVHLGSKGWGKPMTGNYLISLSQEHGILRCSNELLSNIEVGDMLGILPVHSCLTASCTQEYITLDGKKIPHLESQKAT